MAPVLPCQTTPMCPIWAPHMKVCIWNGHKPVVLARNLFTLTHEMIACDCSFLHGLSELKFIIYPRHQ